MISFNEALLVYTVAAFGLAYIAGHSVISKGIRSRLYGKSIMRCPSCTSFAVEDEEIRDGATCTTCNAGIYRPLITLRQWPVLLVECPACFGFWIGLAVAFRGPSGYAAPLAVIPPLVLALYTAGINFILGRLTGLMPDTEE